MNCERVEKLLPLHAGGDIEDARERAALAAHLGACASCRRSAEEWAESASLLLTHEPPEFDADFFDPIRRDVMREIRATKKTAAPSLVSVFARLFSPRSLGYAASLALVCAALVFALRLGRAPSPSKVAADSIAASLSRRLPPVNTTPKPTPERVEQEQVSVKTLKRVASSRRRRAASRQSLEARPSTPLNARVESPRQQQQQQTTKAVLLASSDLPGVELPLVKDEREMLKIDLQTGDPGVRIIWFSPRPNE